RFISKPWSDHDLKAAIIDVLAHRNLLLENRRLADEVRSQRGVISRQQLELQRLEMESPGITQVRWSEDGGVLLQDEKNGAIHGRRERRHHRSCVDQRAIRVGTQRGERRASASGAAG